MTNNIILKSDSYKASHWLQEPPGTQVASAYIEARSAEPPFDKFGVVNFGLQLYLKENLLKPITKFDVEEAEDYLVPHGLPFNKQGWNHILNKYGGFMPVCIEAVDEGLVIPIHNVLLQIYNTDKSLSWLPGHLETSILRDIWYMSSVATISYNVKQLIRKYLCTTSDNPEEELLFKLHDFGARGVSSGQSAAHGGLAHLVNFRGTDTLEALVAARKFYGSTSIAGISIPAAEHSIITSWTKKGETNSYSNILDQFAKPGSMVAVVSDSYDLQNAVEHIWGETLKDKVVQSQAIVIIRPDSGVPDEIAPWTVEALGEKYGYTINSKGYRVLKNVRVIQGDGVNYNSIERILDKLWLKGWSAENIAFGMGGALLQKVNRDTFGFAMKRSAIVDNKGNVTEVYKQPKTDLAKSSKRGILALIKENGKYVTIQKKELAGRENLLALRYNDGVLYNTTTLDEVRINAV